MFGWCLDNIWIMIGWCLEDVWMMSEWCLGDALEGFSMCYLMFNGCSTNDENAFLKFPYIWFYTGTHGYIRFTNYVLKHTERIKCYFQVLKSAGRAEPFKSANLVSQRGVRGVPNYRSHSANSKVSTDLAPSDDPSKKYTFWQTSRRIGSQVSDIRQAFAPIKVHPKLNMFESLRTTKKSELWAPKARCWDHFG